MKDLVPLSDDLFRRSYKQTQIETALALVERADAARLAGDPVAAIELIDAAYEAFDKIAPPETACSATLSRRRLRVRIE